MGAGSPLIVGIGGSTRVGSSSERALHIALDMVRAQGCDVHAIAGPSLILPPYDPATVKNIPAAAAIVDVLRRADGIILSSPGYHGSMSGLIKNVIDYTEEMRDDERSYWEGRAVGCIVCANGHQAIGTTLVAMRSVVHALRGWPTPYAATILTGAPSAVGADANWLPGLQVVADQVVRFARFGAESRVPTAEVAAAKHAVA
ncbi:NADPH-dependent FMN reductase [Bradyrhizobium vignae]|nr:NAD(P)H-dependent oxidoreductase [Bradyrhizobium vignae]